MKQRIPNEIQEIMEAAPVRPCVSIILPLEPKMSMKPGVLHLLKQAADKVESEIAGKYPADTGRLVIQKLRRLITDLDPDTQKSSIAIYVSPVFEKILYLDICLEERIMVDNSFEIRDLIYAKKQLHKYLVLLLGYDQSQVYLGNSGSFIKIVSNTAHSAGVYNNDAPERVANFSDPRERKEKLMEKFLHYIDNDLDLILKSYPLPVFVLGTKRITGHFKKLTRHAEAVIQYLHGNYGEASAAELRKALQPSVQDWKNALHKDLLNRVNEAFGKGRLALGIKNVCREAVNQNGRLLIVEKDYTCAAVPGKKKGEIHDAKGPYNKYTCMHDAVDQVIEEVLECGGDVEFVDKDMLAEYGHIALIQRY